MADDAAKNADAAVNLWNRRLGERWAASDVDSAKEKRLGDRIERTISRKTGAPTAAQTGRSAQIDRSVDTITKAISPKTQAAQATETVQPRRIVRVPEGKTYAWQQHTGWSTPKKS